MKKAASILLAFIMLFSLIACSSSTGTSSPSSAATSTPESSKNVTASAAPSTSAAQASASAAKPSASAAAASGSSKKADLIHGLFGKDLNIYPEYLTLVGGDTGYITDKVDYKSRPTLHMAFIGTMANAATKNLIKGMMDYSKFFNYKLDEAYCNNDNDLYMNLLDTYSVQGVKAFFLNPDTNIYDRVAEVVNEMNIPYMFVMTPYMDKDKHNLAPCVGEDNQRDGTAVMQWLLDNYKKTLGDINMDNVGVIGIETSTVAPMVTRVQAGLDVWKKAFPGREKQFHIIDTAAQKNPITQEAAYTEVSAYVSAHPEVKYWLVPSAAGLYANGAARALEALKVDKNSLICSVGIEELINQWNSGYNGCWAGCLAIDPTIYCLPMITGLIALGDGRATADTLWKDLRANGDKATYYIMDGTVITRDTYVDYAKTCKVIHDHFAS